MNRYLYVLSISLAIGATIFLLFIIYHAASEIFYNTEKPISSEMSHEKTLLIKPQHIGVRDCRYHIYYKEEHRTTRVGYIKTPCFSESAELRILFVD